MEQKKAQAWGLDLVIASVIFLAALLSIYFYTLNYSAGENKGFRILDEGAGIIGDNLLSEGSPEDWNGSSVTRIGLMTKGHLNLSKAEMFYQMALSDYPKTRELFRVTHNYYVNFSEPIDIDGESVQIIGVLPSGSSNVAKSSRVIVSNNKISKIEIVTWS